MTSWLSQLSDASINAEMTALSNTGLLGQFYQSADLQSAQAGINASSNPALAEQDVLNAWVWKTNPSAAYIKIPIGNTPIYLSKNQLILGSGGAVLLLFLLLR